MEMEDKPYSVDSSDDINIEEEDEHIETNHSEYKHFFCCLVYKIDKNTYFFVLFLFLIYK